MAASWCDQEDASESIWQFETSRCGGPGRNSSLHSSLGPKVTVESRPHRETFEPLIVVLCMSQSSIWSTEVVVKVDSMTERVVSAFPFALRGFSTTHEPFCHGIEWSVNDSAPEQAEQSALHPACAITCDAERPQVRHSSLLAPADVWMHEQPLPRTSCLVMVVVLAGDCSGEQSLGVYAASSALPCQMRPVSAGDSGQSPGHLPDEVDSTRKIHAPVCTLEVNATQPPSEIRECTSNLVMSPEQEEQSLLQFACCVYKPPLSPHM